MFPKFKVNFSKNYGEYFCIEILLILLSTTKYI